MAVVRYWGILVVVIRSILGVLGVLMTDKRTFVIVELRIAFAI